MSFWAKIVTVWICQSELCIASQSVVRKTEQHHTLYSHHLLDELFQYFRVYNNMIGFHMT